MKKTLIISSLVLMSLSILIGTKIYYRYNESLINVNDKNSIIEYILKTTQYKSIKILKEEKCEDYYCVLYSKVSKRDASYKSEELMIFRKSNISFLNRYDYYGKARSSKDFNTYNGYEGGKRDQSLIVVYGNNQMIQAKSYCVKNEKLYANKNIDNKDYILDIYILHHTDNCSSLNQLFDNTGNLICLF